MPPLACINTSGQPSNKDFNPHTFSDLTMEGLTLLHVSICTDLCPIQHLLYNMLQHLVRRNVHGFMPPLAPTIQYTLSRNLHGFMPPLHLLYHVVVDSNLHGFTPPKASIYYLAISRLLRVKICTDLCPLQHLLCNTYSILSKNLHGFMPPLASTTLQGINMQ